MTRAVKWIKYIRNGYMDNNLNFHRLYRQYLFNHIFNLCLQRRMWEQIFNNHKMLHPKPCEYRSHWSNTVYCGYLDILFSIFKAISFSFWIDCHRNSHYTIVLSVFTVLCSCTTSLSLLTTLEISKRYFLIYIWISSQKLSESVRTN